MNEFMMALEKAGDSTCPHISNKSPPSTNATVRKRAETVMLKDLSVSLQKLKCHTHN